MTKKKKKTKLRKIPKLILGIIVLLFIVSFGVMGMLFVLDVVPSNYFTLFSVIFLGVDCLFTIGLLMRNKLRVVSLLLSIIYILICLVIIFYEGYTYLFLKNIHAGNTAEEVYQVVVLNNSNYNDIKDLENKDIGILDIDDQGYKDAISKLNEIVSNNNKTYNDNSTMSDDLLNKNIDALLIDSASNEMLKENDDNYNSNTKVLYEFKVSVVVEDITKSRDVTKEPFNIFISGIDTYGKVSTSSRSDVNIVVSVDPVNNKVVMTHIPRDYYVTLAGYKSKDKLTHAGIKGIDCSVKTVEELLDIDINYYVKLNFTSLIDVVNAIGGIEVNSNYTFTTGIYDDKMKQSYTFYKGKNTLDGDEALAFVRERHAFSGGDKTRGENQLLVIEAILKKCMQTSILTNYTKLLSSIEGGLITNLSDDEISSLVKMQLKNNSKWSFESVTLDGTGSYEFTYSYPKQKLYVMIPDEESVNNAKNKIKEIYNSNNN